MKNILILFILITIVSSCAEKREGEQKNTLLSNFVSITDNEDKGVNEILDFYGGYCEYAVGTSVTSEKGTGKYFELKLSKSEMVKRYANIPEMPASNIAYLFYKNLRDEQGNYSEIHTVLILEDGKEKNFEYSVAQLETVSKRISTMHKIVGIIKAKKFEEVKPYLNDKSVIDYDKNDLVANLEKVDPQFGEVKEFIPYGFKMNTEKNGNQYLHVSGVVLRDLQSHEFSADFDLNSSENELLVIEYKF